MEHVILKWQGHERERQPKEKGWYWGIGIIATGVAVASLIAQNYLFAVIAIVGAFTVMLVVSAKPARHTYTFTENGFMIGKDLIPYSKIRRFAISEDEPRHLTIEALTLVGYIRAPLVGVDYRTIRTELKNRDIEEEDHLDRFVDGFARRLGL